MGATLHNKVGNGLTPCRLPLADWPVCFDNGCYLNCRCPVFRGSRPNPVRDYLPLPPVFILLGPYEALPISYCIPAVDPDFEG